MISPTKLFYLFGGLARLPPSIGWWFVDHRLGTAGLLDMILMPANWQRLSQINDFHCSQSFVKSSAPLNVNPRDVMSSCILSIQHTSLQWYNTAVAPGLYEFFTRATLSKICLTSVLTSLSFIICC